MQDIAANQPDGLPLVFDGTLVIVGGGAVDTADLVKLKDKGAHIVAADGGAETCAEAGIEPEAIIGDMDSLDDTKGWARKTRLIRLAEQETTDFEKCLYASKAPVTVGLGLTGKRFDHTLAALDAVLKYGGERVIVLVDEEDVALALTGAFSFAVAPGDRVSLHPLESVRFAGSEGLAFPLQDLTLAPGVRTGTSNFAPAGPFAVLPAGGEEGVYLLILAKRYLPDLIAAVRERQGVTAGRPRQGPPRAS